MPKHQPLADPLIDYLRVWIEKGAPEFELPPVTPEAPAGPGSPESPRPIASSDVVLPVVSPSSVPSSVPTLLPLPSPSPSIGTGSSPIASPFPQPISGIVRPMTFRVLSKQSFYKRCVSCHGSEDPEAGVDLSRYETAKNFATDIARVTLIEETMPPRRPLGREQKEWISLWLVDGLQK